MTNPIPLEFGKYYHIYNRGNNRGNVFLQERNYAYFMELWWKHIRPMAETFAYCLLRNHFHGTVYIKEPKNLSGLMSFLKPPSQYFSNFFNAYTRGVNLATGRTGALFERPFGRREITSENYLIRLVIYVGSLGISVVDTRIWG